MSNVQRGQQIGVLRPERRMLLRRANFVSNFTPPRERKPGDWSAVKDRKTHKIIGIALTSPFETDHSPYNGIFFRCSDQPDLIWNADVSFPTLSIPCNFPGGTADLIRGNWYV